MATANRKSRGDTLKYVNRRRAMMAILTTTSLVEAADKSEIPYSTLQRWAQEPEFARELAAYQDRLLDTATGELVKGMASAARALITIVESPISSEMGRIAAARSILDYGDRLFVARGLERRMKALEASELDQSGEADNAISDVTTAVSIARTAAKSESVRSAASVDAEIDFGFQEQSTTGLLSTGSDNTQQRSPQDSERDDQVSAAPKQAVWTRAVVPVILH